MAKAFKQHLWLWLTLVLLAALAVAVAVWLADEPAPPAGDQLAVPVRRQTPPDIELLPVAKGLSAPVDIAATGVPDDKRLFVVEQGGRIKIIEDGQVKGQPFLDISEQVLFEGEQGLLGLVFDPDFRTNDYFYVNYVRPSGQGGQTVIARFTADDGGQTPAASQKIILTVAQPYANHNAGDLNFGPDGYLYFGLGDGGSGGDPQNRAQSPNSLLGKILRIDVDSEQAYDVPDDNPFVGRDGYRPEIWSLGWRNPWRFSFDPLNGDMWVADVGQNQFEEINHEPAGKGGRNYGWRCYEGGEQYNFSGCTEDKSSFTFPVAVYAHEGRACSGSVSGGYVYRGQDWPALEGFYFYADYCKGRIYSLDASQATYTAHLTKETKLKITTFGVDNRGELYLADAAEGNIYQLVAR